jgi:ADP-ribose pyrophosphatase YjhB (NUDIX family)
LSVKASVFKAADFGLMVSGDASVCVLCGRTEARRPILVDEHVDLMTTSEFCLDSKCGVCEPCAYLAAWRWRAMHDEVATPPFPTTPKVAHVLIMRQRTITAMTTTQVKIGGEFVSEEKEKQISDPVVPRDILMVRRKEDPSSFALPGGKVGPGELPTAAAVRELREETGLHTWPAALEMLHVGFTARGKLSVVYLCRAYAGEPSTREEAVDVEWKPGSPLDHSTSYRGYYVGVDLALNMKVKMQEVSGATAPLCGHLGKAARSYLDLVLDPDGQHSPDDRSLMKGYEFAMTGEERRTVEVVHRPPPKRAPAPPTPAVEIADEGDDDDAADDVEEGS